MSETKIESGKPFPGFTAELGDRIDQLIKIIGTQAEAAKIAGVRSETVAGWKKGDQKPSLYAMMALCAAADRSIEWLATGDSTRDSSGETSQVQVVRTQQEHGSAVMMQITSPEGLMQGAFVLVPRMEARASAGTGLVAESDAIEALVAFEEAYLRSIGVNPRFARLLEIVGDSMAPTLADRDQVVVDTSISEVRADALYAVVLGGAVMVKRLQLQMDGSVLLQSDNKSAGYRDHRIASEDLHEFKVVGRVCGQFRRI